MHRILVVDDSLLQREKLKSLLSNSQFEVETAGSGEEALQLIRSQPFDCVLLDLIMPGLSGQEVLKTMRNEGMEVPVVVVTADIQDTTREACMELGATAIINKPREKAELMGVLKGVLGNRRES